MRTAFRSFVLVLLMCLGGACNLLAQTAAPSPPVVPPTTPPTVAPLPGPQPPAVQPVSTQSPAFSLQIGGADARENVSTAIQIVFVMTLLTLAPSLVMMMTSFTRLVIVLAFVRTALGVPAAPANQLIIGLSLILTFLIMGPVWNRIQTEALNPYVANQIDSEQALKRAEEPLRAFMLRQTKPSEVEFFLKLSGSGPTPLEEVPMSVVLPAFVVSELSTAFQMGFLIFIPFMVIDFLVGCTLMAMGMMMMPPTLVSMPLKILLFVLVDGWHLVIRSLVESFGA